jgi:hypothetical protein
MILEQPGLLYCLGGVFLLAHNLRGSEGEIQPGQGKLEPRQNPYPEVTNLSGSWNQEKVYSALVDRGEGTKKSPLKPYVYLYQPQDQNAAILYRDIRKAPVHINHRECNKYWKKIKKCLPFLTWVNRDPASKTVFDHYSVDDWDAFAKALNLESVKQRNGSAKSS